MDGELPQDIDLFRLLERQTIGDALEELVPIGGGLFQASAGNDLDYPV